MVVTQNSNLYWCDGWCHMVDTGVVSAKRGWFQLRFQAMVQTKLASKARRFSGLGHTYLSTATPHSSSP